MNPNISSKRISLVGTSLKVSDIVFAFLMEPIIYLTRKMPLMQKKKTTNQNKTKSLFALIKEE